MTTPTNPEGGVITLSVARLDVCLEAVWEIEHLSRALPDLVPLDTGDSPHFLVRGIAGRLVSLSNALLSALDDDDTDAALRQMVLLRAEE